MCRKLLIICVVYSIATQLTMDALSVREQVEAARRALSLAGLKNHINQYQQAQRLAA